MTTTTTRKARQIPATTTELTTAGELVRQAREHGSGGDHGRIQAALTQLTERTSEVGLLGATDAAIIAFGDHLADSLLNGGTIPADLREQVVATMNDYAARQHEAAVIAQTRAVLKARQDDGTRANSDDELGWLDEQLRALLAGAAEQAPHLDGITTAEQAIRAGKATTDAWTTLGVLADQYREVRQAQKVITSDARGNTKIDEVLHWAGVTREPMDEIYSEAIGSVVAHHEMLSGRRLFSPDPWPEPILDEPSLVPTRNPRAFLLWLAARGDAWVPNVSQLEEAMTRRVKAIRNRAPVSEIDNIEEPPRPRPRVSILDLRTDLQRDLDRRRDPNWTTR